MFEVSQNNQQPEKKSYGKFGIFLVIFAFLCVAGFLYYYFSKTEPVSAPEVQVKQKTDEEKVKADMELIKQGYGDYISGEVKEISENKDKIIISTNIGGEEKKYTVLINDKTTFYKTIVKGSEEIEVELEDIDDKGRIYEDNTEYETITVKIDDVKVGFLVGINLSKLVKLDDKNDFIADKINISENTENEEGELLDGSVSVKTDNVNVNVSQEGSVNIETEDSSVSTSTDGNVGVGTSVGSVSTNNPGL